MEDANAAKLARRLADVVDLTRDSPVAPRHAAPLAAPGGGSSGSAALPRPGGYKASAAPRVKMWEPPRAPLGTQQLNVAAHASTSHVAAAPRPPAFAALADDDDDEPDPGEHGGGRFVSAAEREQQLAASIDAMIAQATDLMDIDMDLADVAGMKCRLMPHQVQGHEWMKKREEGAYAGGILADDMGLGKTVQMLALMVSSRTAARAAAAADAAAEPGSSSAPQSGPFKPLKKADKIKVEARTSEACRRSRTTLIVAPLAVVRQWEREALEKTEKLKVMVHHGPARAKTAATFSRYDVVITTYTTAASEYKAKEKPQTKTAAKPAAKKGPSLDESDDETSSGSSSASDSDDAPSKSTPRKKPVARKVGAAAKPKPSPLFDFDWKRVVLDEAQNIKNHKAQCSIACFALSTRAHAKWVLTGTPIQNNAYEMYALIHFLRIPPFDDFKHFKEKIGDPLKSTNQNRVNWGMKRLCVVLQTIMLRRTKESKHEGKPLLVLPKRTIDVVESGFDTEEERLFYGSLQDRMRANVEKAEASGKVNQMAQLVMLLRLRQACNHPGLVASKLTPDALPAPAPAQSKEQDSDDDDDADELADLLAGMAVERKCGRCQDVLESRTATHCDACEIVVQREKERGIDWDADGKGSTKVRMLLTILDKIKRDEKRKGEKTIVFSQFTSFLDIIEPFLKRNTYNYVRYDGSMKPEQREANLEALRSDPATSVILISFKAGSTGLNLTCCNHVVLCDLWWNPALEMQAFDRAYRLGQTRDVRIYKLVIAQSVEQRILELQKKKSALAKAALEGSKLTKQSNKLSRSELMYLFSGGPVA